jgi:hypothetical protein
LTPAGTGRRIRAGHAGRRGRGADRHRGARQQRADYAVNGYDTGRYEQVLRRAAKLMSLVDARDAVEIEQAYRGRIELRTPLAASDAAAAGREVFHLHLHVVPRYVGDPLVLPW